jgi:hypothetical protein
MKKRKLTDKEKKVLSFLHFRFRINGKFRKEDIKKLNNYVKVSQKELDSMVKKFLEAKFLIALKAEDRIEYYLTDNVTKEMIDEKILKIRNFLFFKTYSSKI